MAMGEFVSDYKAALYATFINRRDGTKTTSVPAQNRITINKDMRSFCDSFDFDILFRFDDTIDLHSHDFVEFYFIEPTTKKNFQVCCGYVEDFVKETTQNSLRFQANGRDFLGQLFNIPFLKAKPLDQTTVLSFLSTVINQKYYTNAAQQDTYLAEYLRINNRTKQIEDLGAATGALLVPNLSDSKVAPVLQQTLETVLNFIYQDRKGRVVVFGVDASGNNVHDTVVPYTLSEFGDRNVKRFVLRENYSKVFSEVKIQYVGAENNLDYYATPSNSVFNSEKKARQIFQPEVRTFQTANIVTTNGTIGIDQMRDAQAKSILRRSNQNLSQVNIQSTYPFYVPATGDVVPYEVNQVWRIYSKTNNIDTNMRLVSIHYNQTESELNCELGFVGVKTVV